MSLDRYDVESASRAINRARRELEKTKAAKLAKAQSALKVHRARDTIAQMNQSATEEVVGFLPVIGIGEILYEVNFPTPLTGNLAVFGGGVLTTPAGVVGPDDNSAAFLRSLGLTRGNFPTWSVGVARWRTRQINSVTIYTGAVFVFVVTGVPSQESTINWTVRGTALRQPVE